MKLMVQDHVATITLDRPEVRNALRQVDYDELTRLVREADADREIRCLVITGADPAFCSGDDVRDIMVEDAAADLKALGEISPTSLALLTVDVPIIAAVNGTAVGWGFELAIMTDLRVASDRARFGEIFVKRGLCTDVAGLGRLASLVGRELAADLVLTGRVISAQEALAARLVGRVVPHDQLLPTAYGLAASIAANPPQAVRSLKAGLRRTLDPDWPEVGRWVSAELNRLFLTADHKESVAAFLEKRDPVFTGE